jgi:dihydroneopterin aldolase
VIVVPGGGPFADTVRIAQTKVGFDDAVAHRMALLGMEQNGRMLASLRTGFDLVHSACAIRSALQAGGVPIWSPTAMVPGAADVPANWDVTSDSLAAWLTRELGVKRLLLVKHVAVRDAPFTAAELVSGGIVDPSFPRFLAASKASAYIAAAQDHVAAASALRAGEAAGHCIVLHAPDVRNVDPLPWPA